MRAARSPSYNTRVRKIITFLVGAAVVAIILAETTQAEEYQPPGDIYSIEAHFVWCAEGKTPTAKISRYEQFWKDQAPKDSDGYDDSLHIRLVRRCAYRLAELYVDAGRKADCLKTLKWLEEQDDVFDVER